MVVVFCNWVCMGFIEGILGYISVCDFEYEDCIWMNFVGKYFGLFNVGDMFCIQIISGWIVGGNKVSG